MRSTDKTKSSRKSRKSGMNLKKMLIVGIATILMAGCGTYKIEKTNPTLPRLSPIKVDGLICFSESAAVKLGAYIIELESR